MTDNKFKVLFVYRNSKFNQLLDFSQNKQGAREFRYGADQITAGNYQIQSINLDRNNKSLTSYLSKAFETPFNLIMKLGFPVIPCLKRLHVIQANDIVVCVTDAIGLAVLFFKALGMVKGKIVIIFQSLPERTKYFKNNPLVMNFLRWLLKNTDLAVTLSLVAQKDFCRDYFLDKKKLGVFNFGVDTEFWKPSKTLMVRDYVLSIGNDMNRDYQTLINALDKDQSLIIITTNRKIKVGNKDVRIFTGISDKEVRDLYWGAKFVVIPSITVKNESSGLSATLQAMACGKPVIISDSPPMRELFVDGQQCIFYKPQNSASLKAAIRKIRKGHFSEKIARGGNLICQKEHNLAQMGLNWQNLLVPLIS